MLHTTAAVHKFLFITVVIKWHLYILQFSTTFNIHINIKMCIVLNNPVDLSGLDRMESSAATSNAKKRWMKVVCKNNSRRFKVFRHWLCHVHRNVQETRTCSAPFFAVMIFSSHLMQAWRSKWSLEERNCKVASMV